jgi:hypothetical protein
MCPSPRTTCSALALALAVAVAIAAALVPARADACASCACGDPTLTAIGVEKPYRNRLRVAIEERYGSLETGDQMTYGERSWFLRSSLLASWTPLKWLTLNGKLPWVTQWISPMRRAVTKLDGLGDLELWARFTLYRDRGFAPRHLVWGTAGLKFPTGYRVYDGGGYPFPDDDQPGSGSWDPFAGLTYGYFSGGLVSVYASASYRYTTPGPRGYRRGSELGASAAVQLQPWQRVAFAAGIDATWTQASTLANGADAPSTGGFVGNFAPALLAMPLTDLLLRLAVDVPVVTHLYGDQRVGTQVALSIAYDVR